MNSPPNELELAILHAFAGQVPALAPLIVHLRVAQRELTGAGSYTTFVPLDPATNLQGPIVFDGYIDVPGPPNGLGAALWLEVGILDELEIFTIGTENWDGSYDGFSLHSAV